MEAILGGSQCSAQVAELARRAGHPEPGRTRQHRIESASSTLTPGHAAPGTVAARQLAAIVEATIEIAQPQRIILFGSAARGEMNADSDLDLLVIAEKRDRRARPRRSAPVDVVVTTAIEVEANRHDPCCFIHDALREGRVLYDARAEAGMNLATCA